MVAELRHRRGERGHTGGDADGNGDDIAEEQRGAGGEGRQLPEIVLGDDVGAATRRVRLDRLPVGDTDDQEQGDDARADGQAERERAQAGQEQHVQNLLRGVGDRGEGVGREDRQRFGFGQTLVSRLRGTEGSADDGALDLAKGPSGRSPRFERFFGGDEVTGRRALEIARLHPADPDIAITRQAALHTLLADEIPLDEGSLPAPRSHAPGAMVRIGRGLASGNRRSAVLLGVDERSRCRLFDAIVAQAFAEATITAGDWCVCVCR